MFIPVKNTRTDVIVTYEAVCEVGNLVTGHTELLLCTTYYGSRSGRQLTSTFSILDLNDTET